MRNKSLFGLDWWLLVPVFVLVTISLVTLLSLSKVFFLNQLFTLIVGLIAFFLASRLRVEILESFSIPNEKSIADAIVDQTAYRKDKLVQFIRKTGGRGWLATNENILNAQELVAKHTGLEISTKSAISIVGALQAASFGY